MITGRRHIETNDDSHGIGASGKVKELAAQFGVHRDTVHNILIREVSYGRARRTHGLPERLRCVQRTLG